MAEKLIKQFTIGSDTGKIDYEEGIGGNKPDLSGYYSKAEVDAKLALITPKKAVFTYDANVSEIVVRDYETQEAEDMHNYIADGLSYVYAKNGDFGYPCIDGTGQINFSPALATGYDVTIPTVAAGEYNKIKSPYSTCISGLYRITKVTSDLSVDLVTKKEVDMEAWEITYAWVLPEDYAETVPSVIEYRCEDSALEDFSGVELTFTDNQCISKSYHKDMGFPDKSDFATGTSQLNFKITNIPAGYKVVATLSGTKKTDYNKLEENSSVANLWKATKIANNLTCTLTLSAE